MARQVDAPTEKETAPSNHYTTFSNGRGWLYGLAGLVILVIVFIAGAAVGNHRNIARGVFYGNQGAGVIGPRRAMGGLGRGLYSTQNRISGVVTSVNGSTFTVAGNGSTTTVTTSSSTQYQGGNSVMQNDSVLVYGTLSNNTFNAAQIVINP